MSGLRRDGGGGGKTECFFFSFLRAGSTDKNESQPPWSKIQKIDPPQSLESKSQEKRKKRKKKLRLSLSLSLSSFSFFPPFSLSLFFAANQKNKMASPTKNLAAVAYDEAGNKRKIALITGVTGQVRSGEEGEQRERVFFVPLSRSDATGEFFRLLFPRPSLRPLPDPPRA